MRACWIVVVAGCWSSPPPTRPVAQPEPPPVSIRSKPRGPSHCERAIDHVVVVMQPELDRNQMLKDRQQQLRDAAVEGCVTTGWSEDALTCYDETADVSALRPCFDKLTDDQRTDFNQRVTDAMKQPVP